MSSASYRRLAAICVVRASCPSPESLTKRYNTRASAPRARFPPLFDISLSVAEQTTLFQLLARQPWWVTVLVALGLFWIAYAVYPSIAPFFALPFVLLAIYIAIQQWRSGVPSDPTEKLGLL